MERRYDASIAGTEPVYQPPDKSWALQAQAAWLAAATMPGATVGPMPEPARKPTTKERVALRREVIEHLETVSGIDVLPQWIAIFIQLEPLLGPPTIDIESDSPGGRTGSWIHHMLSRATDRPTMKMLDLVSGLLDHWIIAATQNPDRTRQWALLVPPLPALETWRPDMVERFDFQLLDAARKATEETLAPPAPAPRVRKVNEVTRRRVALDRSPARQQESLCTLQRLLAVATLLDHGVCPGLSPAGERHFTHALAHLRLQLGALLQQSAPGPAHPQHAPASFRYTSEAKPGSSEATWKTGPCSIVDCLEHSLLLRAHITTSPGAFDRWSRALKESLLDLPADQANLPLKRIQNLVALPQIRDRPEFVASLKEAIMLKMTPAASSSAEPPKPVPRF